MGKLKNGMRVRLVDTSCGQEGLTIGEIYTITGYESDDSFSLNNLPSSWSGIDEVEPVYTWESKFNIGDKVVYNNSGAINIVSRIIFENNEVFYTSKGNGVIVRENMLSLYEEPKVKEMTVAEIEQELGYTIKVVK